MEQEKTTSHEVCLQDGDVVYIRLPGSEKGQKVKQSVSLREIMTDYKGYDVMLDFSEEDVLVGIEILAF